MIKIILLLAFIPVFALGADPVVAQEIGLFAWGKDLLSLMQNVKTMPGLAATSALIMLILNATKTTFLREFFHKLSDQAQLLLSLGLSAIIVGLQAIQHPGLMGLWDFLFAVGQSSAGAMFFHEFYQRVLKQIPMKAGNDTSSSK